MIFSMQSSLSFVMDGPKRSSRSASNSWANFSRSLILDHFRDISEHISSSSPAQLFSFSYSARNLAYFRRIARWEHIWYSFPSLDWIPNHWPIFIENFGIELSSQEVPLQVLSSIYNVSQLSSRWISVVPLSTLKTPKQK